MSRIGPFEMLLDGWQDITDESGPPPPYTLVSDDGGVLQLSPAIFRGGKWPNPFGERVSNFHDEIALLFRRGGGRGIASV